MFNFLLQRRVYNPFLLYFWYHKPITDRGKNTTADPDAGFQAGPDAGHEIDIMDPDPES